VRKLSSKRGKSEEYVLSELELQRLWNECKELDSQIVVGLLVFCGLRVSEAIHLRLEWIRDEEIHIPSQQKCSCAACADRGYWVPKTKQSVRVVPVPGFLKPLLWEYLKTHPEGLQISRQAVWYRIQHLASRAKVSHIFPHALRATYATLLASKGLTAPEICAVLGWARITMGEHYVRIAEARGGAREKIKQIWGTKYGP